MSNNVDTYSKSRTGLVELILRDLHTFRKQCSPELHYTVDENIRFFEAARSLWSYVLWLIYVYPRIDRKRIRELSDFRLRNGTWEEQLLKELTTVEQWRVPDLLGPLRKELMRQLQQLAVDARQPLMLLNLGCGAMEIERQIANRLAKLPLRVPVVLIGIDSSLASLQVARENLRAHTHAFEVCNEITPSILESLRQTKEAYALRFVSANVMTVLPQLSPRTLDVIYHSKFLHHLSDPGKVELRQRIIQLADRVVEFDDYRGLYLPITSLLMNWHRPVLLNGAVFSSLRVPSRTELRQRQDRRWKTKIIPLKGYIKMHL